MPRGQRAFRSGMTLVELLIVISVAVLLLAATAPLLRIPLQDRKTREASRQLSAVIGRVKARAAELRRPVGLLLRRSPTGPDEVRSFYSYQLYMTETPSPYMGDDSSSGAVIPVPNSNNPYSARLLSCSLFPQLIAIGDLIRFDYQGPLYEISGFVPRGSDVDITFTLARNPIQTPPAPTPLNTWVPFQIFRSPLPAEAMSSLPPPLAAANPPIELPNGVAIDLSVSGIGLAGNQFTPADPNDLDPFTPTTVNDATDVVIMFAPDGSVDRVYYGTYLQNPTRLRLSYFTPTGTVYLLVGRVEQVNPTDVFANTPEGVANLLDQSNIWVSIAHKSGKVTSAENAGVESNIGIYALGLAEARRIAASSQDMGGR